MEHKQQNADNDLNGEELGVSRFETGEINFTDSIAAPLKQTVRISCFFHISFSAL